MKRILPLFLVVLLLGTVLCVPVLAQSSYSFFGTGGDKLKSSEVVPEGDYYLKLYDEHGFLIAYTSSPFHFFHTAYFEVLVSRDCCFRYSYESSEYLPLQYDLLLSLDDDLVPAISLCYSKDGTSILCWVVNGLTAVFEPASASPLGISNIVTSDMLTGSMDHIVDLLPVVLVVIVAFIGIRKGISFLLQFLRSA